MQARDNQRPRTFSLRDLFLMVASVALGLAVGSVARAGVSEGILATCCAWLVLRFLAQAHVLWYLRPCADNQNVQRGVRFGKFVGLGWRILLCVIMLGHLACWTAVGDWIAVPRSSLLLVRGDAMSHLVFQVAIFGCLVTDSKMRRPTASKRNVWREIVVPLAALTLCVTVIAGNGLLFVYIVHTATTALEAFGPLSQYEHTDMYRGVDFDVAARNWHFMKVCCWGTAPLVVSLVLLPLVARMKEGRFLIGIAMLSLSTTLYAFHLVWLYTQGVRSVTPALATQLPSLATYCCVASVVLLAGTWATIRLTAQPADNHSFVSTAVSSFCFRREHPALLVLIAVAAASHLIENCLLANWAFPPPGLRLILKFLVTYPENYISIALFLVAVGKLAMRWLRRDSADTTLLWSIAATSFCGIWPVATANLAIAVGALPWLVFSGYLVLMPA